MSTERFHFLTVIGRAAGDVERACEALLARQHLDSPDSTSGADLPKRFDLRIQRLCTSLLAAADALPVLHHTTYVDPWDAGNRALSEWTWTDGRHRSVSGLNYGIAYFPKSEFKRLPHRNRRGKREMKSGAAPAEWYLAGVAGAFDVGERFGVNYVVLAIAECLGGTREDYEIRASLTTTIPGVSRTVTRRPNGRSLKTSSSDRVRS